MEFNGKIFYKRENVYEQNEKKKPGVLAVGCYGSCSGFMVNGRSCAVDCYLFYGPLYTTSTGAEHVQYMCYIKALADKTSYKACQGKKW